MSRRHLLSNRAVAVLQGTPSPDGGIYLSAEEVAALQRWAGEAGGAVMGAATSAATGAGAGAGAGATAAMGSAGDGATDAAPPPVRARYSA